MNKSEYKIVTLTALGGALEFYDFTIYALFAFYIGPHFFPDPNALIGLLNTFVVFALGYVARPLGGLVFGYFGDKYGRKSAFTVAVFIMASTTLCIGCLPTYQQIGIRAPILLICLRLIQGFSVGGEIPGAALFIMEHVSKNKQGRSIGLVFMSITLGNTLGACVGLILTHTLTPTHMMAWGWRIPFFIGFILGIISYLIRKKTLETPVFNAMKHTKQLYTNPFLSLWSLPKRELLNGCLMTAVTSSIISFFLYLTSYLIQTLHIPIKNAYWINLFSFLSFAAFTALFGYLSDYVVRQKLLRMGALLVMFGSYGLFYALHHLGSSFIWIFIMSIALLGGIVNGSYVVIIGSTFPSALRYSALGLSYSLGVAIFGGIAPLAFTWLMHQYQNPEAPALYIIFCAMITAFAIHHNKPALESRVSIEEASSV